LSELPPAQARAFYGFQIAIENIHSEMYSLMIDAYVKDTTEKNQLFHAVDNFESVAKKADWAIKWIDRCTSNPNMLFPRNVHVFYSQWTSALCMQLPSVSHCI
jgi:ribonucleotide reductase beta subunit family protein with ferritin-like domain